MKSFDSFSRCFNLGAMKMAENWRYIRFIYWGSTGLVAAQMLASAVAYLTLRFVAEVFRHEGFPQYFRIEVGLSMIPGALVLLWPRLTKLHEWTYAGFTFLFVSAFIAHLSSGDPLWVALTPLVTLALLGASYFTRAVALRGNG